MKHDWKYPKIINYKVGMSQELYLIQEKLDGCNIQLEFTPGGELIVYSRSMVLDTPEKRSKLFGLGQFMEENPEMKHLISTFKLKAFNDGKYYRLAGEFFGNSIQKRINYNQNMHDEKCFRIFDIFIEGCKLPPVAYLKAVEGWNIKELCAPQQLLQASSMDDAVMRWQLNHDLEKINSFYSSEHGWEGIVLKNSHQMVKFKRESFGEIKLKTTKEKKVLDISKNSDILDLVNDNRIASAVSKLGEFDRTRFKEFLSHIIEDIIEDYDNEIYSSDVRKVLSQAVANQMKQYFNM